MKVRDDDIVCGAFKLAKRTRQALDVDDEELASKNTHDRAPHRLIVVDDENPKASLLHA